MILLVDGYNVLRHINPQREATDHERTQFLHMLKRYARPKKHTMIVVFDGGGYRWPHKETIAGVKVIYSGERHTADEVIMQYIIDHKTKDLLLISSDHELNLFASSYDIVSIGSDDFYRLLQAGLQNEHHTEQEALIVFDEDEEDLNVIMEQASVEVPIKEEDRPKREVSLEGGRHSKKDRLLLKKLKKL